MDSSNNGNPSEKSEGVQYNRNCTAVKRLLREAIELANPTAEYSARPLEDNLFEWHFTIRGPTGSEFETGIFHGRIIFPAEYPMQPPAFSFLTPNGRFATGEKICLSISNYHPETWLPSWSIRTALVAIISFMTSSGNKGNIGELNYPVNDRKVLARRSLTWECPTCGINKDQLSEVVESDKDKADSVNEENIQTGSGTDENKNLEESDVVDTKKVVEVLKTPISDSLENDVNQGETLGEEFVGLALAVEDQIGSSGVLRIEETDGNDIDSGTGRTGQTAEREVDLATVIQNATNSGFLDFGIGMIVIVIAGIFFRRLLIVYPSLGFGLF